MRVTGGLVVERAPRSMAAEAYRTLRTNLQFQSLDKPRRSLVVTSATAGEGKTTTAANFGAVVAQAGIRVCIIDADLRRPNIHEMFAMENKTGLSHALRDGLAPAEAARSTRIPNLSVITSGPLPPNPAEVVGSRRMRELLDGCTREFDLVICDTPPVLAVADGIAVAAQCEGVILVVAAGTVPTEVVRRARDQLAAVKADIVGVLLNRVTAKTDGYYNGHYYSYRGAPYGGGGGSGTNGAVVKKIRERPAAS